MSIKITGNPDGTTKVECGPDTVIIPARSLAPAQGATQLNDPPTLPDPPRGGGAHRCFVIASHGEYALDAELARVDWFGPTPRGQRLCQEVARTSLGVVGLEIPVGVTIDLGELRDEIEGADAETDPCRVLLMWAPAGGKPRG